MIYTILFLLSSLSLSCSSLHQILHLTKIQFGLLASRESWIRNEQKKLEYFFRAAMDVWTWDNTRVVLQNYKKSTCFASRLYSKKLRVSTNSIVVYSLSFYYTSVLIPIITNLFQGRKLRMTGGSARQCRLR